MSPAIAVLPVNFAEERLSHFPSELHWFQRFDLFRSIPATPVEPVEYGRGIWSNPEGAGSSFSGKFCCPEKVTPKRPRPPSAFLRTAAAYHRETGPLFYVFPIISIRKSLSGKQYFPLRQRDMPLFERSPIGILRILETYQKQLVHLT